MANWKKREGFSGFWKAYLEREAEKLFVARHWDALANVIALLIYRLVLFPNFEGFINSATISIFWAVWKEKESSVHSLLVDTFRNLHARHEKKSDTLICCLPLLYSWFILHMFKPNSLINEMTNEDWAKTLVFLSSKRITWYRNKMSV